MRPREILGLALAGWIGLDRVLMDMFGSDDPKLLMLLKLV